MSQLKLLNDLLHLRHEGEWRWLEVDEGEWRWMDGDKGEWSLLEVDEGDWRLLEVDEGEWSLLEVDEGNWKLLEVDEGEWRLLEVDEGQWRWLEGDKGEWSLLEVDEGDWRLLEVDGWNWGWRGFLWMGHRYGQRFSLKGLGAIPVINGFWDRLRLPFWIFFKNRWPRSPAACVLRPWSAPGRKIWLWIVCLALSNVSKKGQFKH